MKVFIEQVETGATYKEVVYDFWIDMRLSNGQVIKVFDLAPFDLRKYIDNEVEVLLLATFLNIPNGHQASGDQFIKGKFIGPVELPPWEYTIPEVAQKHMGGIDTDSGLVYVNLDEAHRIGLIEQQFTELYVGRFDLVGLAN